LKTIEDSNVRKFLLGIPGYYRVFVFSVLVIMMNISGYKHETEFGTIPINYLIFLAFSSILYFVFLYYKRILTILLLIEYFTVLFYAYIEPHFLFMEIIWIPGIITALAFVLPKRQGIIMMPGFGIAGTIFFSYGSIYDISITIGEFSLPYIALVFFLHTPITLSAIILNRICFRIESMEKQYLSLKTINTKLNEINNVVSRRIFKLQNDMTQKERNRLSKKIHDTAGYVFINLIMMLQAASAILYKDIKKSDKLINDARDYAERGINEIRHLLTDIREYTPVHLSLQNEFFDVGDSFQKATGVKIDIEYGMWPKALSKDSDSFFISFVQESLTNALKHGHATHVSILCWSNNTQIGMTIIDNGSGAVFPIHKGIGLTAMEDMAKQLNGSITIKNGKDGFKITAVFPDAILNSVPVQPERYMK
jgi:signal transduction histidine kinase